MPCIFIKFLKIFSWVCLQGVGLYKIHLKSTSFEADILVCWENYNELLFFWDVHNFWSKLSVMSAVMHSNTKWSHYMWRRSCVGWMALHTHTVACHGAQFQEGFFDWNPQIWQRQAHCPEDFKRSLDLLSRCCLIKYALTKKEILIWV